VSLTTTTHAATAAAGAPVTTATHQASHAAPPVMIRGDVAHPRSFTPARLQPTCVHSARMRLPLLAGGDGEETVFRIV
jgi:hypothetical protein